VSSISDDANVSIILADYAAEDAAKKINMLGGGWTVTAVQPNGLTPAQAVVALIQVPGKYRGQQMAVALTLVNEAGDPVTFPSPAGQATPLRIQQLVLINPPIVPGIMLPDHMPCSVQIVISLDNGLPLPPNQVYTWRFEIDGNEVGHQSFYCAGPNPGPVLG
jgi:hypothetical protein